MDSIIVYGAGHNGGEIAKRAKERGYIDKIACFVDKEKKGYFHGVEVYGLEKIDEFSKDSVVVISISDTLQAQKIVIFLINKGFSNIYLFDGRINDYDIFDSDGNLSFEVYHYLSRKPVLDYLDYHVVDNCNLNCKSCQHLSNLYKENTFASVEEYAKCLNSLSKTFSNIDLIQLLGGEALLNPDLDKWLYVTKDIFPYSNLTVLTNGILVPQMSEKLMDAIRRNRVTLVVTWYPILNIRSIIDFLEENNISFLITERVYEFSKSITRDYTDYRETYSKMTSISVSCTCHNIRNRRFNICPVITYAYENKDFLGLDITEEEYMDSSIGIEEIGNAWDFLNKINSAVPLCKICTVNKVWSKWECNHKSDIQVSDWVV